MNTTASDTTPDDTLSLTEAIAVSNGTLPISSLSQAEKAQVQTGGTGVNTIDFNIPGSGVQTITPFHDSQFHNIGLPAITNPVVIDGYSQPGSSKNTAPNADNAKLLIEINGEQFDNPPSVLDIQTSQCVIQGLIIDQFQFSPAVMIEGPFSTGNVIRGNFLAVDPTGTNTSEAGFMVAVAMVNGASNNTIGGTTPDARNLMSSGDGLPPGYDSAVQVGGFNDVGVESDNLIEGNFIGVDVSGNVSLRSSGFGIFVDPTAVGTTIGGTTPGAGNVISGLMNRLGFDLSIGIVTAGRNTLIVGNKLGVTADGTAPLPNDTNNIEVDPANGTTIGTADPASANVIANSKGDGVLVDGPLTTTPGAVGTTIRGNTVFGNQKLGIEVEPGANGGVTPPLLANPVIGGGRTTFNGTLTEPVAGAYLVEFFSNPALDPSGFGQGQTSLGVVPVTVAAGGQATPFQFPVNGDLTGQFVSALATDPNGNTSSFARTVPQTQAVATPTATTLAASPRPATVGQDVTFTAVVAGSAAGDSPGVVTFTIDGRPQPPTPISVVNGHGQATFHTATLSAGTHAVFAAYGGSPAYGPSTSDTVTETVNPDSTTTTLTSAPNPSGAGQAVLLTATVTATSTQALQSPPTGFPPYAGTVTFLDGSTILAVVPALRRRGGDVHHLVAHPRSARPHRHLRPGPELRPEHLADGPPTGHGLARRASGRLRPALRLPPDAHDARRRVRRRARPGLGPEPTQLRHHGPRRRDDRRRLGHVRPAPAYRDALPDRPPQRALPLRLEGPGGGPRWRDGGHRPPARRHRHGPGGGQLCDGRRRGQPRRRQSPRPPGHRGIKARRAGPSVRRQGLPPQVISPVGEAKGDFQLFRGSFSLPTALKCQRIAARRAASKAEHATATRPSTAARACAALDIDIGKTRGGGR